MDSFDPFYDRMIKERWVDMLDQHSNFRLIECDIRDASSAAAWLDGADAVIHLAAIAGVRASLDAPGRYMSINVGGTTAVLEACRSSGVTRVILASSSSVYGDRGKRRLEESDTPLEPVSPYGVSKYACELIARVYARIHGFRIAALRFFSRIDHTFTTVDIPRQASLDHFVEFIQRNRLVGFKAPGAEFVSVVGRFVMMSIIGCYQLLRVKTPYGQ